MSKKSKPNPEDKKFPLPIYKKEDDIYNQGKEEPLEEEQPGKKINKADKTPGDDLDIPGAELDNVEEEIGEEDE